MDADVTDEHGWLTAIRVHRSHSKFLLSNAHCSGVILVAVGARHAVPLPMVYHSGEVS